MLLFSAIAIPLEPVQRFWKSKKLQGITKGILLVVLFFVAVGLAPTDEDNHSGPPADQQAQEIDRNIVDETIYDEPASEDDLIIDDQQEQQKEELPEDADSDPDPVDDEISPPAEEESDLQPVEIEPEPAAAFEPDLTAEPEPAEEPAPSTAPNTSTEPSVPDTPSENSASEKSGTYVGSTQSDKYHVPSCRHAKKIEPENEIWFDTVSDAQAADYTSCGVCHPR